MALHGVNPYISAGYFLLSGTCSSADIQPNSQETLASHSGFPYFLLLAVIALCFTYPLLKCDFCVLLPARGLVRIRPQCEGLAKLDVKIVSPLWWASCSVSPGRFLLSGGCCQPDCSTRAALHCRGIQQRCRGTVQRLSLWAEHCRRTLSRGAFTWMWLAKAKPCRCPSRLL